ncbi:hypothetical protein ABBQ32_001172 [Trebouxia sp. C0010 RCD-2024]
MGFYQAVMSCFGFLLRLFATITLITGAGFIALGCVLENPPRAPVPALCVTVGVLAIITSALGFIGSHYKRSCLSAYVFFGTIVSTVQLILVLAMFVDAGGIVDRIEAYDLADGETWITRDEIAKKLDISRVVFLFVVVIDFVGLALAMIMRGMSDHPYSNAFEDPELGFSHQQQSEATPLSHPSPYDTRHKTAALELQDRPQK